MINNRTIIYTLTTLTIYSSYSISVPVLDWTCLFPPRSNISSEDDDDGWPSESYTLIGADFAEGIVVVREVVGRNVVVWTGSGIGCRIGGGTEEIFGSLTTPKLWSYCCCCCCKVFIIWEALIDIMDKGGRAVTNADGGTDTNCWCGCCWGGW